jgi:hypothetical protein
LPRSTSPGRRATSLSVEQKKTTDPVKMEGGST